MYDSQPNACIHCERINHSSQEERRFNSLGARFLGSVVGVSHQYESLPLQLNQLIAPFRCSALPERWRCFELASILIKSSINQSASRRCPDGCSSFHHCFPLRHPKNNKLTANMHLLRLHAECFSSAMRVDKTIIFYLETH